ncbi:ion channel [Ureaplasma ceti]|uniref:Potassium channel domain-containing protein n=1 Tax=Ureaplasma ceti TaxID=3119530 RepID=A0ABP9UAR5_9BACT
MVNSPTCENTVYYSRGNTRSRRTFAWLDYLNRGQYWLYRLTDINANRKKYLNYCFYIALAYNVIISLLPIIAIVPIIINFIANPYDAGQVDLLNKLNYMMAKYMYVEYIFCFILISDWILRFLYTEYKYPFVSNRWKSRIIYLFKPANLYQLTSIVILIVLFKVYGHIDAHGWWIDYNVLGSKYVDETKLTTAQALFYRWNPGELIFVTLYAVNIFGLIPRLVTAFKDQTILTTKTGLWAIIKKRWRTPVVATIFLIILFIIFSFLILKTEQSYYNEWSLSHPGQSLDNAPNYSSSPKNVWQSLWFCLVTMTTVGYGQIIPQSPAGRIICIFLIIIGISYYSFYTVFFVSIYTKFLDKKDQEQQDKEEKLVKEEEKRALINDMKKEFVSELLKYGVIEKTNYNQVQFEERQKELKHENITFLKSNEKITKIINRHEALINAKNSLLVNNTSSDSLTTDSKTANIFLSSNYNYKAIISPNLKKNHQMIMLQLDSDVVSAIFAKEDALTVSAFFKPVAPIYKTTKVVIVDKVTNIVVGEVSVQNVVTGKTSVVWNKYGAQSGIKEQFYQFKFGKDNLVCAYIIDKVQKYKEQKLLSELETELSNELSSSFVYLK